VVGVTGQYNALLAAVSRSGANSVPTVSLLSYPEQYLWV